MSDFAIVVGTTEGRLNMYIRWKEKPRAPKWGYDENHLWRRGVTHETVLYVAYLVENKRRDGKPRQTTVYLASIQEGQIPFIEHRRRFWQQVQKKMQNIPLAEEQLHMITKKLLQRVPDVTKEQVEAANEAMTQVTAMLKRNL
jgi:cation transport regulator ChaC